MHPHLQLIYSKITDLNTLLRDFKMTQDEFTAQLEAQAAIIDQTKATVDKVYAEIQANTQSQAAAIDALKAELAAAATSTGTELSESAIAALDHIAAANAALSASVQSLDDLTPDA